MGVIMHNNIPYGGGSTIEPNPQESATEQLETLGIDGDVYSVKDADAVHSADVGVANGVAELDSNGKVPSSQLPSYVDDVLEYASVSAFPATGETGKIYVALDTNLTYRWSGSEYVEISPSLALGETSSTAYRGDRGKIAYDHSQSDHSTIAPAFTEASTRANIASGESFATILGKIKKFFSDLKTVAFTGAYSDLSGTPTIPTKVSDLTNDSGFVTTDEKVTGEEKNSASGENFSIPFIGTTNHKPYYNDGLNLYTYQGTANAVGRSVLGLGNGISSGTAGNKRGEILIFGENARYIDLKPASLTNSHEILLPNKQGTIALTSDIRQYCNFTLNSSTANNWYYVLSRSYSLGASAKMIVTVANTNYYSTSGTAKPFLLHMHYREMLIKPLSADDAQVDWIKNWRITRDSDKMYLEFQAPNISSGENSFQVSFLRITDNSTNGITIPSSMASSVGTTVMHTYFIDANFRAAKNGDDLPLSGGSMTGQLTFAQNGYKTYSAHGYAADEAGNFAHTDSNSGHWFHLDNQAKTMSLKYYWETGKLYVPADIYANGDKQVITSATIGSQSVDQATKDGDGNTISSTYLKNSNVLMKDGSAVVNTSGYRNIGDNSDYITLSEEGTYLITAWAMFKGGTGNKAVLICRASDNAAYGQSWENSTINQSYPKTFTCFHVATVTINTLYFRARVYTDNTDVYGGIYGGIYAIKVS